jgi:selenide,water dikinase
MSRFEKLPGSMPMASWGRLPELGGADQQPPCGGCGAKVGADALGNALAQLSRQYPEHCRGNGDDAAAIPWAGAGPVIQSLDVLRQMVADPWLMGRIAANHALSDLYACGARPVSALAAVTLPFAGDAILQRELQQLLAGALHEFAAVDCCLTGGHSMQGPELSLGFVVNGIPLVQDQRLLPKRGLAPGDLLLLTKPLGTGTLFAAHMQLLADGRDISTAVESMLQSNAVATELAVAHNASACTDITGFGLLGHLLEMLDIDRSARLQLAQLPLLSGALQQLRCGIVSTMHAANARAGEVLCREGQVDEARMQMLFDPQTSGGLLIGIAADRAEALRDALRQRAYAQAEIIGEVVLREPADAPSVVVS